MNMEGLIYKDECYKINGAIFAVHKSLGPGLKEISYQQAMAIELQYQGIPFEREKRFPLYHRGIKLESEYIADFVCFGKIVLELKAVSELLDLHRAQLQNYLAVTHFKIGLLVNFNDTFIVPERIVNPLYMRKIILEREKDEIGERNEKK